MPSPKKWWMRTASNMKDRCSILKSSSINSSIIHATSHDDKSIDYKHACRIFTLARASPSLMAHLMRSIARRAECTRSWPVALKSLLLAHGLLILISSSDSPRFRGRLPFDLSDFHDRSSNSLGFSAFVRAYFNFLDYRVIILCYEDEDEVSRIERMQDLLDLLMQIYPCTNYGMNEKLVIEAMDCVIVEIFEVYTRVSDGIAAFLVRIMDLYNMREKYLGGLRAMRVMKRANEQSTRLANYLQVCRSLRVPNATEIPGMEKIPEDVIVDLERRFMDEEIQLPNDDEVQKEEDNLDWVIFEDEVKS